MNHYNVTRLIDRPALKQPLAEWLHGKWYVPTEAYLESMDECLAGADVPQWYCVLDGERIVGGIGVIENDFHDRKDLTPNVCAVFVEEEYRCRGIAGVMLKATPHKDHFGDFARILLASFPSYRPKTP